MWQRSLCPSIIRSFYHSKTVMVKPWIHGIVRLHICSFNVCHGSWIQNQELYTSYIDKLLMDGRTDRHDAYREIILNRSCNAFKINPSKKLMQCRMHVKKRRPNRIETLTAIPSSTITFSRLSGKYNICIFTQEIQVFEG